MAAFPRRGPRVEGLTLESGERVLAAAVGAAGTVVATDRRLLVPVPGGFHSIGWENVERAAWDSDSEILKVTETVPVGSRRGGHQLRVEDAGRLLDVVREQVKASLVISRYLEIEGNRGVRVTGRKRPGQRALSWVVAVDEGLPVDAPGVRERIEAAVAGVRAEVE